MAFLHPYFLFGLAGAAVPVLIHLLGRRRARRVPFPSLRLLHAAQKKRRTISRLQRLISLLLRVLAIALLALGLASPILSHAPGWLQLPRPQAVALVLDDSLSMTHARPGAPSAFDRGKAAAESVLRALSPGDRVALIAASRPGEAVWRSRSEARARLAAMAPTALSAKLAPVLVGAAQALAQASAPNRTVLVVTDWQASAWREPPVDGRRLSTVQVVLVDVGDRTARNLSVDAVNLLTPVAITGRPVRLQAEVSASAAEAAKEQPTEVVAQLLVDGKPVAAQVASVRVGEKAAVQFSLVPEAARDVPVRIALTGGPHGLAEDDVRQCTLRVRAALRVLIAAPSGATGPGFYLTAVLNPFGNRARGGMAPEVVAPGELATALARATPDLVILADCPRLEAAALRALQAHLSSGGGMLVFLGDDVDGGYYSQGLLPALAGGKDRLKPVLRFGEVLKAPEGVPVGLTEINTSREPLSPFANPRAGDLGALRITWARAIQPGTSADVLASFDSGAPALLEWRSGKGRVILFNTSADASWGEHVRDPAYVPLLHRLAQYVARPARAEIADVLVGERPEIRSTQTPPAEVTLVGPDGRRRPVPAQAGLLPEVDEPGAYRVLWAGNDAGFAANVDERESDLTRTTEAAVKQALSPAAVTLATGETAKQAMAQVARTRADLSLPLLVLALAVFLFESVFSLIRRDGDVNVRG